MVQLGIEEGGKVVLDFWEIFPTIKRVVVCDLFDSDPVENKVALAFPEENRDCFCESMECYCTPDFPDCICFPFMTVPDFTGTWAWYEGGVQITTGTFSFTFTVDCEWVGPQPDPQNEGYRWIADPIDIQLGEFTITGGGSTWGTFPFFHNLAGVQTVDPPGPVAYCVGSCMRTRCAASGFPDLWIHTLTVNMGTWPQPGDPGAPPLPYPCDPALIQFGYCFSFTLNYTTFKTDNHGCTQNGLQFDHVNFQPPPNDTGMYVPSADPVSFYFHD